MIEPNNPPRRSSGVGSFFRAVLTSCLGTALALILVFFLGAGLVGNLLAPKEEVAPVSSNSVLRLDLPAVLPELTGNTVNTNFSFDNSDEPGLYDIMRTIRAAAKDDDIKGIYFSQTAVNAQPATIRQLRQELIKFREAGKFIIAFSPNFVQGGYYLASAADEVYLGPMGVLDFRGLGSEIPFLKPMLDKIGVDVEVFYVGDYKSATEPLRRSSISKENREQTKAFLEDIFAEVVADIAESRGLTPAEVRNHAANMTGWREADLLQSGLIDGVAQRIEVEAKIRSRLGLSGQDKVNVIGLTDYYNARIKKQTGGSDQVAVIVAEGNIVDGEGTLGSIGDKRYIELVQQAQRNDAVKAVVLRINSGGGSASASENIWAAIEDLKAAGKPIVVSMGDVAASGGYYIAAGADSIFALPSTITGSIGVFNLFPVAKELMNEKIGINFDTVNTTPYANAFSPFQGLSDTERNLLTERAQIIYDQFMARVAEGRGLDPGYVAEIARGRVYGGRKAEEIGLVDRMAGIDEAIASAADLAGLGSDYSVGFYPRMSDPYQRLINELLGVEDNKRGFSAQVLRDQLGEDAYRHFELMRELTQAQGVQARMPMIIKF
ncbi:MAG: signal peptide peptidase SppA [Bacteroidota bacterium]